jgi:Alpha-1,3-glucanase catalytic domain D1/Carbohydrate family 9 binding domain-like/Alpha-1,3-glucanase catalytic domain D2/CARDB/Carbohydrate binding module (family 6)
MENKKLPLNLRRWLMFGICFIQLGLLFTLAPMALSDGLPDLIVTDISWTPANPSVGDAVTFSVVIKNQGTEATPDGVIHGVGFQVDSIPKWYWTDNHTSSLAPGESVTLTVTGGQGGASGTDPAWTALAGVHTITANVDDAGRITESDETNNSFSKSITVLGDTQSSGYVRIKSFWNGAYLYESDNQVRFGYAAATDSSSQWKMEDFEGSTRIKNRLSGDYMSVQNLLSYVECTPVDDSWYSCRWMIEDSGTFVRIRNLWQSTSYINIEGTAGFATCGSIYDTWDSAKWVLEDVSASDPVTTPTPTPASVDLPDLVITDLTWEPANPETGDAVKFSAVIKNQGTGATPAGIVCGVGFQVDGQPTAFWSDNTTQSIPAGGTIVLTVNGGVNGPIWTATAGTHNISAWVDDVNRIAESNDNNNSFSKTMANVITAPTPTPVPPNLAGAYFINSRKLEKVVDQYDRWVDWFNQLQAIVEKYTDHSKYPRTNKLENLLDKVTKKLIESYIKELVHYPISKCVIGKVNPANTSASKFGTYWDCQNFYVVVNVMDAKKIKDSPNLWDDDGVEVMLDMNHGHESYYGSDDFQFIFGYNNTTPVESKHNAIQGVKYCQIDTDQGYIMIATIPWSALGKTPLPKSYIGLDVAVDDDYDGGARDSQVVWNSKDDQEWQYPNRFGDCQFMIGKGEPVPAPTPTPTPTPTPRPTAPPYVTPAPGSRGALIPWDEYEAENGVTNGVILGPSTTTGNVASEASGRKCVQLDAIGKYVEVTTTKAANSIVVRYSIPDAQNGGGITAPISLYINGVHTQDITLTSKYSWNYGAYPWSNDPSYGAPRHFFDEAHALVGNIPVGAKVKLQVDAGDNAGSYIIDLIDLEQVGPSLTKPADFLSITDFGAIPNDGIDDTNAIVACINAAKAQGKGVWIPDGTFQRTAGPQVATDHPGYSGAGFVTGFATIGATARVNLNAFSTAGSYPVTIHYANGSGVAQTISLYADRVKTDTISLEPTANWDTWADKTITVNLKSGTGERIGFTHNSTDSANINIDYLTVNGTKYEIENGYLTCPIYVDHVSIQGAGIWYTTLAGYYNQFVCNGDNCKLSDFAIFGETDSRNDELDDNAFAGYAGTGSVLQNLWVEHTKCGFWVGNSPQGRTNGLLVTGCRFRDTMADGVNLCDGTTNSIIENCHARNTGDDSFAIWSAIYSTSIWGTDSNIIRKNTVQLPWLAQGVALYGGYGNTAEDNLIFDVPTSAGILVSTTFDCIPFSGITTVQRNSLVRCGAFDQLYGGIRIMCDKQNISGLRINNLDIYDSTDCGIRFMGAQTLSDSIFDTIQINWCGAYGIYASGETKGAVTINNVTVANTALGGIQNEAGTNFTVTKGPGNSGW